MKRRVLIIFALAAMSLANAYDRKNYFVTIESYRSYTYFTKGVRFFHDERYEAAVDSFKRSLNYDPTDEVALYWYGKSLLKAGLTAEALLIWQNIERMGLADALLKSKIDRFTSPLAGVSVAERFKDFIYLRRFSENPSFVKNTRQPIDVLINNENTLFVLDYADSSIKLFDMNGNLLREINKPYLSGNVVDTVTNFIFKKAFNSPRSISFDLDGYLYIADTGNHVVYKMNENGKLLLEIGGQGFEDGLFYGPSSVAVDEGGKVYVADTGNNRIQIFSSEGKFLWKFGSLGKGEGEFFRPTGVAVSKKNIYVADTGNMRVQTFDKYGNYITVLNNESFFHPRYIKEAKDGNLFMSDERRIYYFNQDTSLFTTFYRSRRHSTAPMGIAESDDGALYVADFLPGSIDVYVQKEEYYANVDVSVEKIIVSAFPKIVQKVSVRDGRRQPLIGLNAGNFFVEEFSTEIKPVQIYKAHPDLDDYRFIFLVDDSLASKQYEERMREEIAGFAKTFKSADEALIIHYNDKIRTDGKFLRQNLSIVEQATSFKHTADTSAFSEAFYEAVRKTFKTYRKSAIIIFSATPLSENDFSYRTFTSCYDYAKNNFVPVSVVRIGDNNDGYFLNEIASNTYAHVLNANESINYEKEVDYLKTVNLGDYYIIYETIRDNPTRDKYRPVTVKVMFRGMSGKEESGYIVP